MFTIYSKPNCTYCDQAKALLDSHVLGYQVFELDVGQFKVPGNRYVALSELEKKVPGVRTVPQIFHGEKLIGGFTELRTYIGRKWHEQKTQTSA